MQFWQENFHKFPKLYQLHLKHHRIHRMIPATSAAMERCFRLSVQLDTSWICSSIQAEWSNVGRYADC